MAKSKKRLEYEKWYASKEVQDLLKAQKNKRPKGMPKGARRIF